MQNGQLDEFCIWTKVLSSDERTFLYNSGEGVYFNGTTFEQITATTNKLSSFRRGSSKI